MEGMEGKRSNKSDSGASVRRKRKRDRKLFKKRKTTEVRQEKSRERASMDEREVCSKDESEREKRNTETMLHS